MRAFGGDSPSRTVRRIVRDCCPVCGGSGEPMHERLVDRWFGVPGSWSMRACVSTECGAWYLDPAPDPDDIGMLYQRYYTHDTGMATADVLGSGPPRLARLAYLARRYGYSISPRPPAWLGWLFELLPGRREHLDLSVMQLDADACGPLLDVGCGSGTLLRLMGDLGWDAEGIDLDPAAVAVALEAGLRARVGTLADPSLPERHFAAVTSNHVLEHVVDPREFLCGCLRVTRPGGRLALTTPNARSLGSRVFGARWRGLEPPRHFQVFTARSLARVAQEAGYVDVQVRTSARLATMIVRETIRPDTVGLQTSHQAGIPLRVLASGFQMVERALLPVWAEGGEELLLSARAPGETA